MRHIEKLGTLTISSGQTNSSILANRMAFGAATDVIIFCPSTLPETVVLKGAALDSAVAADFRTLNVSGGDITLTAGKAVVVPTTSFAALMAVASVAVAADRAFDVVCQVDI